MQCNLLLKSLCNSDIMKMSNSWEPECLLAIKRIATVIVSSVSILGQYYRVAGMP